MIFSGRKSSLCHFTKKQSFRIFSGISCDMRKDKYVSDVILCDSYKANSFTVSEKSSSASYVCINIYDINSVKETDLVDDIVIAHTITQCFHEKQHAYQNAVIDTGKCRMTPRNKEIANMGILCEFFPKFYMAGYKTDVREIDAEMAGIMDAKEYCEKYLPNFDYDAAMLQYARESEFAIIKGDFKDLDEMLDAGEEMLHSAYYKTRPYPSYRVPNDTGYHCDRAFVTKYGRADYEGTRGDLIPGHEQVVMLFDTLLESQFAEEVKERCPALKYRYDITLKEKYEQKARDRSAQVDAGLEVGDRLGTEYENP